MTRPRSRAPGPDGPGAAGPSRSCPSSSPSPWPWSRAAAGTRPRHACRGPRPRWAAAGRPVRIEPRSRGERHRDGPPKRRRRPLRAPGVRRAGRDRTTPTGDPGAAAECAGNDENRDFYMARRRCRRLGGVLPGPGLRAGSSSPASTASPAGAGSRSAIAARPGRASPCARARRATPAGCVPTGDDLGPAAFGGLDGSLLDLGAGGYAVVVDPGANPSWTITGSGLDQSTFEGIAAALVQVRARSARPRRSAAWPTRPARSAQRGLDELGDGRDRRGERHPGSLHRGRRADTHDGSRGGDPPDRLDRGRERQPVRLGHRDRPAVAAIERVEIEGDVPAVDPRRDDRAPRPRARRVRPGRPASRDRTGPRPTRRASGIRSRRGPARRGARHRPRGRSGRRPRRRDPGSPRPQAIAKGMPQTLPDGVVSGVLKSPWASNQASPSRVPGRARRRPASAPAWRRAVAAEHEEPTHRGLVASAPRRRGRRAAAGTRRCRSRFFARGSGSATQPGSLGASPASSMTASPRPGRAASAGSKPGGAQRRGRPFHARRNGRRGRSASRRARWAGSSGASCGHDAGHAHRRLRPGTLFRPLGVRRRAPPVRVRRPGHADGRAPRPGRRRDARAVGRPDPRLHRIDRPSAAPARDRRALRARRAPTTSSSSPAPRRRSSASPTCCWGRATTPSSPGPATRACTRSPARPAPT